MMSDKDNNLLKSDILTVGSELSEKLNTIGVPNTFGKASEGKDNLVSIIRMTINGIDMITKDYYNKSEVNTLLNGKSDTSHNHDSAYASKNHNHDTAYASKSHQHDGADVILSNNNDLNDNITDINNTVNDHTTDITSLNGNITSINASITDINNTVNDHTTDITSLNGNITSINDNITDINNTVNNHTTTFTGMIEKHNWNIPAFSLGSGKGVQKTVTVPNPSGYYRVPIIQGAYKCYASSLGLSGTTLTVKIQNHYSSNANASMYGIILYFKSSIIKEI